MSKEKQTSTKLKNGNDFIADVVCCALCNTELEDYEINTCRQMGATEPEMICEICWNRIQNEGYENVMP